MRTQTPREKMRETVKEAEQAAQNAQKVVKEARGLLAAVRPHRRMSTAVYRAYASLLEALQELD